MFLEKVSKILTPLPEKSGLPHTLVEFCRCIFTFKAWV
jgi:hypothetical protein